MFHNEMLTISSAEMLAIDKNFESEHIQERLDVREHHPQWQVPREADQIGSVLAGVSPLLDDVHYVRNWKNE